MLSIACTGSRWASPDEALSRLSKEDLEFVEIQEFESDRYWNSRHSSTFIIVSSSNSDILYSGLIDSFPIGSTIISLPHDVPGETIKIEFTDYRIRSDKIQHIFSLKIPQDDAALQELNIDVKWIDSDDAFMDYSLGKIPSVSPISIGPHEGF